MWGTLQIIVIINPTISAAAGFHWAWEWVCGQPSPALRAEIEKKKGDKNSYIQAINQIFLLDFLHHTVQNLSIVIWLGTRNSQVHSQERVR